MDPSEHWLRAWHDRRPGATSRAFLRAKPSSYAWLAMHTQPGDRALDLACGDGALLELLRARGLEKPVGIDMSEGELAAARTRLGPDISLLQGRAQALPFADGAFDCVTCHMALMLMRPVEEAIAEMHRVLRPGGTFVAVVGGGFPQESAPNAWRMLAQRLQKETFHGPPIGDRRAHTEEGLRELLSYFKDVHTERLTVDLSASVDDIVALVYETYNVDLMAPDRVGLLEESLRLDWQTIVRPDGLVPCFLSLIAVKANR